MIEENCHAPCKLRINPEVFRDRPTDPLEQFSESIPIGNKIKGFSVGLSRTLDRSEQWQEDSRHRKPF